MQHGDRFKATAKSANCLRCQTDFRDEHDRLSPITDDFLDGSTGLDTLSGGRKNDIYYLDDLTNGAYDKVVETRAGGIDLVYVSHFSGALLYTLPSWVEDGAVHSTTGHMMLAHRSFVPGVNDRHISLR